MTVLNFQAGSQEATTLGKKPPKKIAWAVRARPRLRRQFSVLLFAIWDLRSLMREVGRDALRQKLSLVSRRMETPAGRRK
jgi:hypothetical protein